MLQQPADPITLSCEEVESLMAQVHQSNLPAAVVRRLEQIIRTCVCLVFALQEPKITVSRLRRLLCGKNDKGSEPDQQDAFAPGSGGDDETHGGAVRPADAGDGAVTGSGVAPVPAQSHERGKPKGGHRPRTGRLGAAASWGARRAQCCHDELAVGQRCPVCGQGKLYQLPAGVEVRIDGNALLSAIRYELEKLRCSACGAIFTAGLPEEGGAEKYSARARAVLAVSRYYLGVPSYRLQGYQALLGVPVPDATQWDQLEVVGDCAYKVFEAMEREAAQGELIFQDDTAVRILSLMQENRVLLAQAEAQGVSSPRARTGMHTTALAVKVGEHIAILYYSSRRHAGENLQALRDKRASGREKPLAMSDALSSNEVGDESMLLRCHCLAHGRRKFSDLEAVFPHECRVVLEVLSQVFDHDEQAREGGLSPEARLAYHQVQSQPLMDELHQWLDHQSDDHLVEPNSSLGNAISYMRPHWSTLTRFLAVKGAPIDNHLAERVLKLCIRPRKNSLVYQNPHSAYIASVLTSLIATCIYAGVKAVDYLVALQEHRREVGSDPAAWLPWASAASRASP